jgi:Set1/Ash2 histone methyltransferase complex subunit ASH2
MRSGDRQAPVGFDKWSYGYRDSSGSKIHKSVRVDDWGGEGFKAGDIVGFGITLNDEEKVGRGGE